MHSLHLQLFLMFGILVTLKPLCNQGAFTNGDCDNPLERHVIIRNINETIEIGLNKTFIEKFECFQRIFDDNLVRLNKLYLTSSLTLSNDTNSMSSSSNKKKSKSKHQHHHHESSAASLALNEEATFARTGFIFYSLNNKSNVDQFKHESFIFANPFMSSKLEDMSGAVFNSNMTQLEREVIAYSNDVVVLKSLLARAKDLLKEKSKLMKDANGDSSRKIKSKKEKRSKKDDKTKKTQEKKDKNKNKKKK